MRNMRKIGLVIIMLALLPTPQVQARKTPEAWVTLTLFAPAIVTVDYTYTHNVSVSDVSSFGPSLYEIKHTPLSLSFEAQDFDEYLFTLELVYSGVMYQQIKITTFGGSHPPSQIEIPFEGDRFIIYFSIRTMKEPSYPTTESITENVVRQIGAKLDEYQSISTVSFTLLTDGLNTLSVTQLVISGLLVVIGGVVYLSLKTAKQKTAKKQNDRGP